MKKIIDKKYLQKAMDFATYRNLIDTLLLEGKVTGLQQSADLNEYTKLNVARMKRIDKTIEVLPELQQLITLINKPQTWIVLTEGWCGDAAQIVPVLYALSLLNDKINLALLLRDDNLELMDQYLTNGKSRSIPKLIAVDTESMKELFKWGPRPQELQDKFDEMLANKQSFNEIKETLHGWYAKDKTLTTQQELLQQFKALSY